MKAFFLLALAVVLVAPQAEASCVSSTTTTESVAGTAEFNATDDFGLFKRKKYKFKKRRKAGKSRRQQRLFGR
ncbi:hypothetical protein [Hymenobacter lucidus]|uniref:Uncharacterized protein n=1 Tax=Hymenobacter lucidus TaxID=2880930 RepID=A0ABS8ASS0_9BACT|nr:hypothetical protein [Hymenobacter lucidus]MCB2409253.1 hypothetical protein [Hymenobacter lucidus]